MKRFIIAALLLLIPMYVHSDDVSYMVRHHNNFLNIESTLQFKGEIQPTYSTRFAKFEDESFCMRAGAKIMKTYINKYGFCSVSDIMHRFAPTNENDTQGYIDFVCYHLDVNEHDSLGFRKNSIIPLLQVMSIKETGYNCDHIQSDEVWESATN